MWKRFIPTHGQGLYEFTREVTDWVAAQNVRAGVLTPFMRHTSCSRLVQENADPDVQTDLRNFFHRLVPPGTDPSMAYLTHTYEVPDDMPAHIKAAMMPVSLSIPLLEGRLALDRGSICSNTAPHSRQVAAVIAPTG